MNAATAEARRIVVVSNRLPFTVVEADEGILFQDSAGGVATGLRALLSSPDSQSVAELACTS